MKSGTGTKSNSQSRAPNAEIKLDMDMRNVLTGVKCRSSTEACPQHSLILLWQKE